MALWTPAQITTLLWCDPSDTDTITHSGGAVSQVDDKSGNANHLVQAVGASQARTGIRTFTNGLNVLDCDGGDYMKNVDFGIGSTGDLSIFCIAEFDSFADTNDSLLAMNSKTANNNDFQYRSGDGVDFYSEFAVSGIGSSLSAVGGPFNGPSQYELIFDYTDTSKFFSFIDGTNVSVGGGGTYSTKLAVTQDCFVFTNRGASTSPNGAFGEVIIVNDVTVALRQKIEGYLAYKWGLEANLPASHPYKYYAPGSGGSKMARIEDDDQDY